MSILSRAAMAALLVAVSGLAQGQVSLTVNGQTQPNNGLTVTVQGSTILTLVMDDPASPLARYGLFGAVKDNGNPTGWYLDQGGGAADPFPVVTGVDTLDLEAWLATQGLTVTISPARPENPLLRLNGLGQRTLRFRIPTGFTGTVYLQAVTQEDGQSSFDVSNAIELVVKLPLSSARVLAARDQGTGNADNVDLGVVSFQGLPGTATFTPQAPLENLKIENLGLASVSQWSPQNSASETQASGVIAQAGVGPVLIQENGEFPRIALPAHPGADGTPGTGDDVPARDVVLAFDAVLDEGFFVVLNHGANPNTPGEDYHDIQASHFSHNNVGRQPWRPTCAVSPDGTMLGATLRLLAGGFDRFFLISLDGSSPFTVGANPSEVIEVTPVGFGEVSVTSLQQSLRFTANNFYFALDDGNDPGSGDLDGFSHVLFQVPYRVAQPTPTLLTIPLTVAGSRADYLSERILVSADGSTLAFLAGNLKTLTTGAASVQDGDWYAIRDANPTTVTNLSRLPQTGAGAYPAILEVGEAYDGRAGYASLSPDGTLLAFVATHDEEVNLQIDDEVYVVPTDGSARPTLGVPVTNQTWFDSSLNQAMDNAQDLYVVNSNEVLFFYGSNASGHTGNRTMDLFHLDVTSGVVTNLTATSGETTPPFRTVGTIYPEGYFSSLSGRYLYFSRGNASQPVRANLVGVDLTDGRVFNVTGSEFSGTPVAASQRNGTFSNNVSWNLRIAGGALGSLATFSAGVVGSGSTRQQVWIFDTESPSGAVELSGLLGVSSTVRSLVPAQDHLGAAFGRSESGNLLNSDVYYLAIPQDLADDLTESSLTADLALGCVGFVPARPPDAMGGNASPPGLIYVVGNAGGAGNPTQAWMFYALLDGTPDQSGRLLGGLNGELIHVFYVDLP